MGLVWCQEAIWAAVWEEAQEEAQVGRLEGVDGLGWRTREQHRNCDSNQQTAGATLPWRPSLLGCY